MSITGRRIAKNASVLMVAQLITWGLAVLLMIIMPRFLGAAAMGKFALASSLWAIVTIFTTFGMDTLLTKEIAREPEKTGTLVSVSIILRALLFVFGFGFLAFYLYMVGYSEETLIVILIIGIANFIVQFTGACQASLQGLEKMEYVSLSDILSKVFITIATIILLIAGYGLISAAIVVVFGALISFLIQFFFLKRLQPLHKTFSVPMAKWMLKFSFPYLILIGIRTIYIQIDIVIISLLVNEITLGWYSVASRLFATFLFIPTVLMTAVFPVMARMHTTEPGSLSRLFRRNFNLLLLLGVPIGLGLVVIAKPLVIVLFGPEFANSGIVLTIFGIVLILTYQNALLGQSLISMDRQKAWTWVMGICALATIPLDLFLIPFCQNTFNNGAIGGALSFVVTEAGMLICGIWLQPKGIFIRMNVWFAAKVLLSGFTMVAACWWFRNMFIFIPIFVGAVTYLGMIIILRVVSKEDWRLLRSILQSLITQISKTKSQPYGV